LIERAGRVDLEHHDRARPLRGVQPVVQVAQQRPVDRPLDLDHLHQRGRCGGGRPRPEREQRQRGEEQGEAAHRAHRTDRGARGILRPSMARTAPTGRHAADRRFAPLALLLLAPVIAVAAVLIAILIAPPIAGLAWGAKTIDARLTLLGADFTHIPRFPERSTIYAADGKTVLATLYLDNREIVDLTDISDMGRKSVLAVEDAQFYEHGPLDWTSLIRALLTNAATGEVVQGGSTITQQLVKNAITGDTSQTFQRKFQELALAIKVEQRYTKEQILALSLNGVSFANGVYGIATAADFYFHVPASRLKLTQSAMLAGLIRSPNYYDPLVHPVKARIRRNVVLDRLAELGWVPQDRIDKAKASPLRLAPG